jgi:hypothetical protein
VSGAERQSVVGVEANRCFIQREKRMPAAVLDHFLHDLRLGQPMGLGGVGLWPLLRQAPAPGDLPPLAESLLEQRDGPLYFRVATSPASIRPT